MAALTWPVSYTNVDTVLATLPAVGSMTSIVSADVAMHAGKAQSLVDAKLASRYTVPFSDVPPLVQTITTDIAAYELMTKRVFTGTRNYDEKLVEPFKMAFELLDAIAEGDVILTTASGTVVDPTTAQAQFWSSTESYFPTMHEGAIEESIIDPDKLDDIASDRE